VLRYEPVLKIDPYQRKALFLVKNGLIEIVPSLGTELYSIRLYTSLERMLKAVFLEVLLSYSRKQV
jgi:hypothetical protein